ncbi:MAG: adenylyl-sulfate kinase [Pseudomonadales bacterium]|nr:adenylyl-sulfate kinase [Pseudomonadales bacterium]
MSNDNIVWHPHNIKKLDRANQKKQKPCLLWFTGLSGSGKSTLAGALEEKLFALNRHVYLLDGDNVRHGLNRDLGFTDADRVENIRRIGEASKLFVDAGLIVLSAFISPFREDREMVRGLFEESEFIEVFMDASLETCERRDPKGLYKKARKGEIKHFTGIDSPYESPESPEITINPDEADFDQCVEQVMEYLRSHNIL